MKLELELKGIDGMTFMKAFMHWRSIREHCVLSMRIWLYILWRPGVEPLSGGLRLPFVWIDIGRLEGWEEGWRDEKISYLRPLSSLQRCEDNSKEIESIMFSLPDRCCSDNQCSKQCLRT